MKGPIKWVGGKTAILDKLMNHFPTQLNNYHEPFLGGGSVLLEVLERRQSGALTIQGSIYASDLNPSLIALYQHIQTNVDALIQTLSRVVADFHRAEGSVINRTPTSLDQAVASSKESFYYWIRHEYNHLSDKTTIQGSAYFIFLNKTCWRGVHREGPHGFNVPYGNNKDPGIFDPSHLRSLSTLIQPVHFSVQSFQTALTLVKSDDFVYLDPPYAPISTTSFVGYTSSGFTLSDHQSLFEWCINDRPRRVHFLLSNADAPLVREFFTEPDFHTEIISVRRQIHSKDPSQTANEVLIYPN